jgi:gliding motility-associated-like protein
VKLTVYNRWGNKVYDKQPYDNSWDGSGNMGNTLGKGKLPRATYYYIVKFNDDNKENITGFVEVQY